jgi:hypothetical protein
MGGWAFNTNNLRHKIKVHFPTGILLKCTLIAAKVHLARIVEKEKAPQP